jgi:hypothetical protein
LALQLGMTVSQLLDSIDSQELTEWWAFFVLQNEKEDEPDLDQKIKDGLLTFGARME